VSVEAAAFTATGNGTVSLTLSWACNATILDIVLKVGTTIVKQTQNTAPNGKSITLTYALSQSLPGSTVLTPYVKSTATGCAWALSGSYPVTGALTLGLYASTNTLVSETTSAAGTPSVAVSVPSIAAGSYYVKVTAGAVATPSLVLTEAHPVLDYAAVTLEFHNPSGTTIRSAAASGGTVTVSYETPDTGGYYWSVGNFSSDLTVPSFTWTTSTVSLASATAAFSVPLDAQPKPHPITTITADAAGPAHVKATWTSSGAVGGGIATPTFAVTSLDGSIAYGSKVGTAGTSGSVDFTALLPSAGEFLVRFTTKGLDKTSNGSMTVTYPKATAASMGLVLKDSLGEPVASSTAGAKPATINAPNLAKGTYSLVVSSTGGGTGTTTGSFTSRTPYVTLGYDALDHSVAIDDGYTTTAETLAPSGRVLERKVIDDATGAVTEHVDYGYADGGDSPAYTRPHGSTNPAAYTLYAGGAIVTAGAVVFQHANAHGDIIGTSDAAGNWTNVAPTDEYGLGTTPSSRLGWLGGQQRFVSGTGTGIIRMGVRLYDPHLGRFLSRDPIEGGCSNDYVYVSDPVNEFDLGGTKCPGWLASASRILGVGDYVRALREFKKGHYNKAVQLALASRASQYASKTSLALLKDAATASPKVAGKTLAKFFLIATAAATLLDVFCSSWSGSGRPGGFAPPNSSYQRGSDGKYPSGGSQPWLDSSGGLVSN
jgi:RHS repeat-associated protein